MTSNSISFGRRSKHAVDYDECEKPVNFSPEIAKFVGPFKRGTETKVVVRNLTASKIVFQVRTTDWKLLRAYPVEQFLQPCGSPRVKDQAMLYLQTLPFDYDPNESYDHRRYAVYVSEAKKDYDAENDSVVFRGDDARAYAENVPETNWKKVELLVQYVVSEEKNEEDNDC